MTSTSKAQIPLKSSALIGAYEREHGKGAPERDPLDFTRFARMLSAYLAALDRDPLVDAAREASRLLRAALTGHEDRAAPYHPFSRGDVADLEMALRALDAALGEGGDREDGPDYCARCGATLGGGDES